MLPGQPPRSAQWLDQAAPRSATPPPGKAEPGKPIYARKPAARARPTLESASKKANANSIRFAPAGWASAVPRAQAGCSAAVPRPRREITITEGITVRDLAEKLDVRAKELLKRSSRSRHFRQHQPGARRAHRHQLWPKRLMASSQ